MRQRINVAIAIEMDPEDLARILNDDLVADLSRAAGMAALALIPRSVEAIVAARRVNVSEPYNPEWVS